MNMPQDWPFAPSDHKTFSWGTPEQTYRCEITRHKNGYECTASYGDETQWDPDKETRFNTLHEALHAGFSSFAQQYRDWETPQGIYEGIRSLRFNEHSGAEIAELRPVMRMLMPAFRVSDKNEATGSYLARVRAYQFPVPIRAMEF